MQLLPVGQLAYNSATTKTTLVLPFFANYGYHPVTMRESRGFAEIAQKASIKIIQMQTLHDKLQKDIQFLSHHAAHYYNKRRSRSPTFLEWNKVYLLQKNIKIKQPSKETWLHEARTIQSESSQKTFELWTETTITDEDIPGFPCHVPWTSW